MKDKTVLGMLVIAVVLPGLSALSLFETAASLTEAVFVAVPAVFVLFLCYFVLQHYAGSAEPGAGLGGRLAGSGRTMVRQVGVVVIAILTVTAAIVAVGFTGPLAGIDSASGTNGSDNGTIANGSGARPAANATPSSASIGPNTLLLNYSVAQTPEPGSVRVTAALDSPTRADGLELTIPEDAEHVRSRGLDQADPDATDDWILNGSAGNASVTYTAPVNTTDDGDAEGLDVGEWALFDVSTVDLQFDWADAANRTEMSVTRTAHVVGQGVADPGFVYLGPSQTYTRNVANGSLRLIVPRATSMTVDRRVVLDFLASAADRLRVGGRDRQVDVFVAPAAIGVRGRTIDVEHGGQQGILLSQNVSVATPDNGWLHEYVHTRQSYTISEEMDWFGEASAEYYAALLTYQSNQISFGRFHGYVNSSKYADAELASLEPQPTNANYFKGMRVLAALDARIRSESDGQRSLEDVFRRMNGHEGVVSYEDFQRFVTDAAGRPLDGWLDRQLRSSAVPTVPCDRSLFAAVPDGATNESASAGTNGSRSGRTNSVGR